jgi:hypothetical protein
VAVKVVVGIMAPASLAVVEVVAETAIMMVIEAGSTPVKDPVDKAFQVAQELDLILQVIMLT